jgi:hypothetical protein
MSAFSWIALILVTVAAYSAASVRTAGRRVTVRPEILDLALLVALWAAAAVANASLVLNRWLLVASAMVAGAAVGAVAAWARTRRRHSLSAADAPKEPDSGQGGIAASWKSFSRRMGTYQSRVLLSFFFFSIVFPFAVVMKLLGDPLRIKLRGRESFWLQRKMAETPDQFWRQY